jgi:hypothetical protein
VLPASDDKAFGFATTRAIPFTAMNVFADDKDFSADRASHGKIVSLPVFGMPKIVWIELPDVHEDNLSVPIVKPRCKNSMTDLKILMQEIGRRATTFIK